MRISDWSSDVCSSDLSSSFTGARRGEDTAISQAQQNCSRLISSRQAKKRSYSVQRPRIPATSSVSLVRSNAQSLDATISSIRSSGFAGVQIGGASCRDRGSQYVEILVVSVKLK